ncbi:synaptonemal complex protein 1-like [Capsicum annuum]|uniref:synaptonemal complex protein 1-like n=1 Tax=Capsicum annuum TaxID=4072 RepID=UPI001FB0A427|nr:synaptonemal complex protein 1-like [Capsicum annuum]XP_047260169.1 synaptonemal complex protein 1-like [Capsicum annuum]XP_047260170.1 synaptonemal complex protein 1-like [Capsicum annuum]XP_047260171.1 synaptonemal complex protein 1-like [Capsicum annuum]
MLEEKLQNAYNANAKLKVKQKEDEKLWKGLESKFSSTKTLCDQLTETLQHLAGVVQDAEKDEASLEDKQSATSVVIDNLHDNMNALYLTLESSEETVRNFKLINALLCNMFYLNVYNFLACFWVVIKGNSQSYPEAEPAFCSGIRPNPFDGKIYYLYMIKIIFYVVIVGVEPLRFSFF